MNKKNSNINRLTDPLMDPYFIQYDQYGYTVMKRVTAGDTGREREQLIGYYSNLDSCLNSIAEHAVKSQSFNTIQDFVFEQKARLHELKEISLK